MPDGKFQLKSPFKPTGDQPQAIDAICEGLNAGMRYQTLLGVTGSGKTFTMANVIERMNRPTLILEPNKTLASQLCMEMREFFPDAAVEFFVSYYDYYQPEAYIPGKDMYIEKDASINDEIDRLRHSATAALLERRDVIIVASVSCIYSLGDPVDYKNMMSVTVPVFQMKVMSAGGSDSYNYGMAFTSGELDASLRELSGLMEDLMRMAELEKTAQLLAEEIERTRRRVNALEYILMPQYLATIKSIKMKLDENERGNTTRLMKVKDMMLQAQFAQKQEDDEELLDAPAET